MIVVGLKSAVPLSHGPNDARPPSTLQTLALPHDAPCEDTPGEVAAPLQDVSALTYDDASEDKIAYVHISSRSTGVRASDTIVAFAHVHGC